MNSEARLTVSPAYNARQGVVVLVVALVVVLFSVVRIEVEFVLFLHELLEIAKSFG